MPDGLPQALPSAPTRPAEGADHGALGRFTKGNRARLRHGLRSGADLPGEFAHLRGEIEDFVSRCTADEGGLDQVPARRRALLEYRARLHRRIVQLDAAIELRGMFDGRGTLRVSWLQTLQGLLGTAKGIDALLGLRRVEKHVSRTPQALVARLKGTTTDGNH